MQSYRSSKMLSIAEIYVRACLRPLRTAALPSRTYHAASPLFARARGARRPVAPLDSASLTSEQTGQPSADENDTIASASNPATIAVDDFVRTDTTPYRGVHLDTNTNTWIASITVDGEKVNLGRFSFAEEAADAYTEAAKKQSRKPRASAATGEGKTGDRKRPPRKVAGVAQGDLGVGRKALITRAEAEALGIAVLDIDSDNESTTPKQPRGGASSAAVSIIGSAPGTSGTGGKGSGTGSGAGGGSQYRGVIKSDSPDASLWEAVYTLPDGREVSGGEYDDESSAARAYDALARMYGGPDVHTNFPIDPYTAWVPPEEVVTTGQIETKLGVPLSVEEVTAALTQERGLDVRAVPLAGRSDLADALVFVTGRSVPHMRKMADMVARALRKRRLPSMPDPSIENREGDDWMVVDCGNIIVSIMDADAREVFALESFYESMKLGQDPYAGQSYDEWLKANPVPDKWIKRLEKDDAEMAGKAASGVPYPMAMGTQGGRQGVRPGGPDRRVAAYHFPAKLKGKPKT